MTSDIEKMSADLTELTKNLDALVAERDALREGVARLEQNAEHFADKYAEAASEVEALSFRCQRMEAALRKIADGYGDSMFIAREALGE